MDQSLLNWVFAGFGTALGWLVKVVWDAIKDLKADMKQIERDLPEIYQRKDDFKIAMADIKADMREIREDVKDGFKKVDGTLSLIFERLNNERAKQ